MASINLIEAFQDFKEAENIDRPTMMKVVEDVFKTLLRKKYGSDENFDVIVNAEKGDLEIIRRRMIVEDGQVEDPLAQVGYSDAVKIEPDFEVGEDLYEEIDLLDFGRRAILAAKQTLASRISDLKKNLLAKKYGDRTGEIISAEVYQVWKKEILLLDEEGNDRILPKSKNSHVINWTNNIQLLIQRSLTPAKITSMELDQDNKHANVYLKPDQVSLAIGRRGVNIKLATELTGFELDVYRDSEEEEEGFDIDLDEFSDEIETWVIDELKRIGCDTGRSVLKLTAEELERRTDLEKETIDEVRKVLKEEFEKE